MDKFPETCNLLRLNTEERENLNWPVTSKDIESIIKNLPIEKKSPGPDGFMCDFYQIFKELMPSLLKLFQKIPKLILWGQHYPDTKARDGYYKKIKLFLHRASYIQM